MAIEESYLNLEVLLAVIFLVLYIIAAPVFEKINFHYMHESGMVMLLGIAITLLFKFFIPSLDFTTSLAFNDKIFFTFVLPLIIFGAGYNLKKRQFFKYFVYIFLLGVVGTLIAFCWVAPLTYFFNQFHFFYLSYSKYDFKTLLKMGGISIDPNTKERINYTLYNENIFNNYPNSSIYAYNFSTYNLNETNSTLRNLQEEIINSTNSINEIPEGKFSLKQHPILLDFSLMDALSFAAVISATDAVAALTFIHEDTEPKLFAILFGEGVVNDAVCIVIYKIITDFQRIGGDFNFSTVLGMIGTFCSLFGWSFCIGLLMGITGSLILKKLKQYNIGRQAECALICLFAYLSYILSEELDLSPIIALLFNGIFNSHYTFYNLSFQAREESSTLSRVLSALAEAFVFVYLGLTAVHYFQVAFSWSFMIFELIVVVAGRFVSVYGVCFLMYIFGVSNFKLNFIEKGISSCSGTIRGAIAFGLSISIVSKSEINRDILLSTTLALVFISTIVFGALMPYFIKFWKSFGETSQEVGDSKELIESDSMAQNISSEEFNFSYLHPNFETKIEEFSKEKNIEVLKKRLSYWLGTYWLQFDDAYLKPKLICNWPEVKKEHDEIAEEIRKVIKNYLEEKFKNKRALYSKVKNVNYESNDLDNIKGEDFNSDDKANIFLYNDLKEKKNENEEEEVNNNFKIDYKTLQDTEGKNTEKEKEKKISRDEIMNKY